VETERRKEGKLVKSNVSYTMENKKSIIPERSGIWARKGHKFKLSTPSSHSQIHLIIVYYYITHLVYDWH
jgi:hypothetical protein